ncbi:MAG: ISL3 family transposase [Mycobacteriales bacterium]|nr:ISL3 family transposase [Mycobacteriales bacterium]
MRSATVWARPLGVEKTTVERVEYDEQAGVITAHVKPHERERRRCPQCRRRCPAYDRGEGRRRWRALDLGTVVAELEADAPRISGCDHGGLVAAVPWARHHAGHTRFFDDQVAWLAVQTSKTAVTRLMRIAWRTVGAIITRVVADIDASVDRLEGLRRIGIDEISYKKGHRYITVVIDHDSKRLVWAAAGRDKATVRKFFDDLGQERSKLLTHVSADGAEWIADVVKVRAPQAIRCADPFHVVAWATEALDVLRRQAWNEARAIARTEPKGRAGRPRKDGTQASGPRPGHDLAKALKGARYALWKNPENLTETQQTKLDWIATTDPRLHRGYLLKEGLRTVFVLGHSDGPDAGIEALDTWLSWAARCRIPTFVELGRKIRRHRPQIEASIREDLSNALVESTNTKIRVLTRVAFGFHSADALIALAMLSLGGHRPDLPGRT